MASISENNLLSQSPYLYMQGAGSDGSDGSVKGVHLRWDFDKALAEWHIPKGNLAAQGSDYYTTAGFNKANDFVKIYRTRYNHNFPIIIDLINTAPTEIIDLPNQTKTWRYNNLVPNPALPDNKCNVQVRFENTIKYNQVKQQYNPANDRLNFLKNYNEIIEVEVEGRMMFSAFVQMQVIDEAKGNITRIESISRTNKDGEDLFISSRKKYQSGSSFLLKENLDYLLQENSGHLELDGLGASNGKIMAENIQYIRFRGDNCFPDLLWLETYQDFLLGKNQLSDWQSLTELSLSIDNVEVFNRLENPSIYPINNLWTKYKNGATVNVANYKTRWSENSDEGLRNGVITYLNLSKNAHNLDACNQPSGLTPPVGGYVDEFQISYLELLKLAAFDFHIARMLGFGYIDADMSPYATDRYMYIAVYETTAALDGMPAGLRTHTFMTLPVGKSDYKLPVTPELSAIKYGLRMSNQTEIPVLLTDENGYGKYDNSRAIGLHVSPFDSMRKMGGFFIPDEEYSYVDYTEPIFFGIAYKKNSEATWRKPEINNDPEFKDHHGVNETVAVIRPYSENDLVYTHFETEEGIHDYAIYGINWFSRVSSLSNILQTDETIFPIRNTLVPPLNLGVQLIQKEEPLIFTTQTEQNKLNAISTPDKTLVRLTFEWNDINASNYWYGREAEFFFRTEALNVVKGSIKSVTDLGQGLYEIRTKAYIINSVPQTILPIIPAGKETHFVGSFLSIDEGQYRVQSVRQSTVSDEGAIFTLKAPDNTELIDPDNNGVQQVVNAAKAPTVDNNFAVAENTSLASSWEVALSQKVILKNLSDYTETDIDSEGNTTEFHIGGVFEKASISELLDIDDNGHDITNSRTGVYRIVFDNFTLAPHGDANVEWYKGTVRVKAPTIINGKIQDATRVLEIWNIESTSPLTLIARDGTFNVNEIYSPNEGYIPISTGGNINVNYHPGYRVYFTHETGFNQSSLLPAAGDGSKQSLIACRSTDVVKGQKIASPLSTPAVILAREIIEPVAPELPSGALFATRPNFYGKATYTFDTKVITDGGREPYALVFYRASEQIILDALYKHQTVLQIQNALAQIENDTFFTDRWNGLVNIETDASGQFKEWNGYRFPNPDLPPVFNASTNPGAYPDKVKSAIDKVFLPLTEQPVVYRYVKTGYQTSDRKPVLRDTNGELIVPGTGNYDGAPMAVKYTANDRKIVRFTDYTLDGASTSFFFYFAREMNNMLTVSERSPILGPIQLINAAPPKAPEINKFYPRVENTIIGDTPAILFEINKYIEAENVSTILIYRAFDAVSALNIQTMQLIASAAIDDVIIDDFSDLDYYPFGEVLYYRLVAVRSVKTKVIDKDNGIYETEDVLSYPSSLILANVIDVINPESPELSYTATENPTENRLEDVVIEWNPTAYNGTYYLYQMNNSGNWAELGRIERENASMQYALPDSLPKTDEDGETIYYRFKVTVENSSGLFSLNEKILTI